MEKERILHILELEELTDERTVKSAYMTKLKRTNPEDDPEEKEKTEIDLWIDQIEEIYRDFRKRGRTELWEELLNSEICQGLDTSLDARDALFSWLLNHFYLPKEVWLCLNRELQFIEDYEELKERYPADFLDYARHYSEYDYFVNFDRMKARSGTVRLEDENVDGYILLGGFRSFRPTASGIPGKKRSG